MRVITLRSILYISHLLSSNIRYAVTYHIKIITRRQSQRSFHQDGSVATVMGADVACVVYVVSKLG